jgi:WD40 repeat protein
VGVVFAGDERIISLSLSGDLNYFVLSNDDPERIVKGHQRSVTAIEYHDGKVYSGSYDGRVLRWKSDEPEDIKGKGHTGLVVAVQGGKDDELWTVGWDDQLMHVIIDQFDSSTALGSQPKAFSVVSETCYVCSENSVEVFEKGKKMRSISLPILATSLSANEQYFAVGYNNNSVEIFKTADLKSHGKIQSLISSPSYLSFSPDGKYLAVGLLNGKIILYDFVGLSVVTSRWAFHSSRITSMSWHKNSQYVVSGSVDSNIFVYSVEKPGKNLKVMGAHKDGVNGVVWTGESSFASAGADATIKNWVVKFT